MAASVQPEIRVADAKTGAPICDASITARSQAPTSPFTLTLSAASNCTYALDASGSFTLDVSHPGYASKSVADVAMRQSDPCHGVDLPSAQVVNVALDSK